MANRVALRPLTPEDAPALAELEKEIFATDAWPIALVHDELALPYSYYVGAEEEARIIGYAGIRLLADADIMTVGVVPTARNRGIGKQLVLELLECARTERVKRVFLEVRESNVAARGLYAGLGFVEIGHVKRYYRHPLEDAITMKFELKVPQKPLASISQT